MYRINNAIRIKAPIDEVFQVLKDFSAYPSFMHYVKKVSIDSNGGAESISSWEIDIDGADINWRQKSTVDFQTKSISFSMISGDYQSFFGKWSVGNDGENAILYLQINIDWGIPSFEKVIGDVLSKKTEKIVGGMLAAIKIKCQRNRTARESTKKVAQNTSTKNSKFAFVIHPLDVGLVSRAFNEPNLLTKKYSLVKKAFEWLPSFQCSKVTGVKSITGVSIDGELMYFSLLPDQIMSLDRKLVLDKAIEAAKIAEKRGANILGLGAYAAQIGKKGVVISRSVKIPVTTGTHYTIYIAIQSILDASKRIGLDLSKANLSIVGATGGIGRICAEFFCTRVNVLTLVGRNMELLENLARDLRKQASAQIRIDMNAKKIISYSDISILCTTTPDSIIDVQELTAGSIVCDISRPRNVSNVGNLERKDVLVLDGGLVQPPGEEIDFNFYFGLPPGLAYACMAETMILAMEQSSENYSIGGDVSYEKVIKIGKMGDKHGFKLAKIISFNQEVSDDVFVSIKKSKQLKKVSA